MTPSRDGRDAPSDSGPSEDDVRRLLAEVRPEGPLPPAVAARLDRALSELPPLPGETGQDLHLQGDQDEQDGPSDGPVDLGARRRRRRAAGLLVAAVAIVAVGLGANALRGPEQPDDSASDAAGGGSSAAQSSRRSPPAGAESGEGSGQESGEESDAQDAAPPAAAPSATPSDPGQGDASQGRTGEATGRAGVPVVRPDAFARDVRRVRGGPAPGVRSTGQVVGERSLGAGPAFVCTPPTRYGTGRLVAVRYQGAAAVLAYRPPSRQSQTVDLLQCGTAQVLRSTTVPRR